MLLLGGHHEKQHGIPLDMPEETQTDALALMCAFDNARNISHHERLVIVVAHDSEVRFQCGERVVRDFRLSGCYGREQCGLSGIRKAYKSDISKYFQFQYEPSFLTFLARLRITRSLLGS